MTPAGAYRRSLYRAGGVMARAGRRSPSADAWLRGVGAREGAILTAWNPMSRRMPEGWNRRQQTRLRAAARRLTCGGEGMSGADPWWEDSLLLAGDAGRLAMLGRRFRQRALLVLARGREARLVWLA